jgi:hypothetical protein
MMVGIMFGFSIGEIGEVILMGDERIRIVRGESGWMERVDFEL